MATVEQQEIQAVRPNKDNEAYLGFRDNKSEETQAQSQVVWGTVDYDINAVWGSRYIASFLSDLHLLSRLLSYCFALAITIHSFVFLTYREGGEPRGLGFPTYVHMPFGVLLIFTHVCETYPRVHPVLQSNLKLSKLCLRLLWFLTLMAIPIGLATYILTTLSWLTESRIFREEHGGYVSRLSWIAERLQKIQSLLIAYLFAMFGGCLVTVVKCAQHAFRKSQSCHKPPAYDQVEKDEEGGNLGQWQALQIEKYRGKATRRHRLFLYWKGRLYGKVWKLNRLIGNISLATGFGFVIASVVAVIYYLTPLVQPCGSKGTAQNCFQDCLCSNIITGNYESNPHCMLPFPSQHLLKRSSASRTGFEFDFRTRLGVYLKNGKYLKFNNLRDADGFSPMTSIMFYAKDAAIDEYPGNYYKLNNPRERTPQEELVREHSQTILIDTGTNMSHPHFLYKKGSIVYIQPTAPLAYNTRYVVGVRNIESKQSSGQNLPSLPMDKLLNGSLVGDNTISTLALFGWKPPNIFLAWDFHTASIDTVLLPSIAIRDDAIRQKEAMKFKHKVISVVDKEKLCHTLEDTSNTTAYTIHAKFNGPSYLDYAPQHLKLPGNPHKEDVNWRWVEYTLTIPCSIALKPDDERKIVHYGHGFLGDRREIGGNYLAELANKNRWILVAVDNTGLTRHDLILLAQLCINQAVKAEELTNTLLQSHINRMLSSRVAQEELRGDKGLKSFSSVRRALRPHNLIGEGYYGNSLGGILGGGFVSLSKEVKRAVLGVPGSPYSLVVRFSDQFKAFRGLMLLQTYSDVDIEILVALVQTFWDPIEGSGWFPCYPGKNRRNETEYSENYPCEKAAPRSHFAEKSFLLQNGVADISVPPITSHLIGAAVNATHLFPARPIPILENSTTVHSDTRSSSLLIEWLPDRNLHRCLRLQPKAKEQVGLFIESGSVGATCRQATDIFDTRNTCNADVRIDPICYNKDL